MMMKKYQHAKYHSIQQLVKQKEMNHLTKTIIDKLIEKGANLAAKAQCAHTYQIKQLVDSGVKQIKTYDHWNTFLNFQKVKSRSLIKISRLKSKDTLLPISILKVNFCYLSYKFSSIHL